MTTRGRRHSSGFIHDGRTPHRNPHHKPPVRRQISDAEHRLYEHPEAFRYGVVVSAPHNEPTHSSHAHHPSKPIIEPPPLPGTRPRVCRSPSPPRPPHGARRHSVAYPSQGPEEHYSDTKIRSILRSRSRPRSGNRSPSPPLRRAGYRRGFEDARVEYGGPRVSFAPEPHSPRRRMSPPHHERARDRETGMKPRRSRPHVDGHYSNEEVIISESLLRNKILNLTEDAEQRPIPGSRRLSDYDYWQEPPRKNSAPHPGDKMHEPDQKSGGDRVVRRPLFSHDPHDVPTTPRVRHVRAPDHVTYHRSATPPPAASAPGWSSMYDHSGRHNLTEATGDTIPWTQQSNPGSNMSNESYKLVDVRDVEATNSYGQKIRVREIEETHHPRKEADRSGDERTRSRPASSGGRVVQHQGWRDV